MSRSDVKYPGFLWVVGIVAAVILLLRFFDAEIVALVFIPLLLGILKGLNLGTDTENIAIDAIEAIKNNPRVQEAIKSIGFKEIPVPSTQYRGPSGVEEEKGETILVPDLPLILPATPPRPNKFARWLVG